AALLSPTGRALVEVEGPDAKSSRTRLRLASGDRVSRAFPRGHLALRRATPAVPRPWAGYRPRSPGRPLAAGSSPCDTFSARQRRTEGDAHRPAVPDRQASVLATVHQPGPVDRPDRTPGAGPGDPV